MKRMACMVPVLFMLVFAGAQAEEPEHEDCPAHRAAAKGVTIVETLHHVMAPAWHNAYPEEDHESLAKAMHEFAALIPDVKKISHAFKIAGREKKFNSARTEFIELVKRGAAAAKKKDTETVYSLMPEIHMSFEEMAYYLLPVRFPEFESLTVVVDLMIDEHLSREDYDAIATSAEALEIKSEALRNAELPEDLASMEEDVKTDISDICRACDRLKAACGEGDAEQIVKRLNDVKDLCTKFEHTYI